jgi:hypothetical protein
MIKKHPILQWPVKATEIAIQTSGTYLGTGCPTICKIFITALTLLGQRVETAEYTSRPMSLE